MKSRHMEPLEAAPRLLSAFRSGYEEFETVANSYASAPRRVEADAANQECLELLDHVIEVLGDPARAQVDGVEDACVMLLEHLAARFHESCYPETKKRQSERQTASTGTRFQNLKVAIQ